MSDLVVGAPTIKAYIRVNDLIVSIDSSATRNEPDSMVSLPALNVETLFSSPAWARAIFCKLNMNGGVSRYKLDPAFFSSYPELYDHNADIAAQGIPLRPAIQYRLTCPKPLDTRTFQTYRDFVDFTHNSPLRDNIGS
jgi:hypothetical protein